MSDEVIAALQERLASEEGFSSYSAIVEWLEKKHGQTVEYATVYHWARYRLGAKLKEPRPQSYQQDEEVVEGFKKNSVLSC
jgi:transposase